MVGDKGIWSSNQNMLRVLLGKTDSFDEAMSLCLMQHAMVHSAKVSGLSCKTFEDELWENLEEKVFRTSLGAKGRTVAYGIWHSSRIEDITMNILVANCEQVIRSDRWPERINTKVLDTGNAMSTQDILEFSEKINMQELRNYRAAVGKRSREIISRLHAEDLKRKVKAEELRRIYDEGAVLNVERARWLVDFWGRKNVAGILLMPATRHHMVHINESLDAKKRGRSVEKKNNK